MPRPPTQTDKPSARVELQSWGVVQKTSPVPYYFQLCTFIEERVKAGEWRPGQCLPSEQEICSTLGISRTVVRQALAHLEQKGLVRKQNGKRTVIAYPKYEGGLMQDSRGFYEDTAARGRMTATMVLDLKIVPSSAEVADALKIQEGALVVMLNRLRFLDGEPEVLVVTYLPENLCASLIEEDFSSQSLYETLARKYGLSIARAFRTIEAIGLERADARLLGVSAGSPALLLRSVGVLADATPLEYFVAKHRGDRCKLYAQLVHG